MIITSWRILFSGSWADFHSKPLLPPCSMTNGKRELNRSQTGIQQNQTGIKHYYERKGHQFHNMYIPISDSLWDARLMFCLWGNLPTSSSLYEILYSPSNTSTDTLNIVSPTSFSLGNAGLRLIIIKLICLFIS